jgi:hypothetical protein
LAGAHRVGLNEISAVASEIFAVVLRFSQAMHVLLRALLYRYRFGYFLRQTSFKMDSFC